MIAPAKTGNDNISKNAVINTDHTNKGILWRVIPGLLMLKIVVIKLVAPNKEDAPAKCRLKIAKSTDPPEWYSMLDKGGYTVQPVPAPPSTRAEVTNNNNDGGSNQKLMLFSLGNAISAAPIINGTNQFSCSLSFV